MAAGGHPRVGRTDRRCTDHRHQTFRTGCKELHLLTQAYPYTRKLQHTYMPQPPNV